MKYEDIERVNKELNTIDIKGKEYIDVAQRVKAFRKLFPMGTIETEMISNENGICIFKATIKENDLILANGTAYEKESSSFINKTSYIENCETSAVGRALGMLGIGDTSIASYEEVANAINNQKIELTEEEAKEYKITFGKYSGKTLNELINSNPDYINWIINNSKDETLLKAIEILTGQVKQSEEDIEIKTQKILQVMMYETKGVDLDKIKSSYKVDSINDMTLEQLNDCITKLQKKYGE